MPLVLSLKQGDDFFVGDEQLIIDEVIDETHFRVRRGDGQTFDVLEDRSTEVLNEVWLSSGDRPQSCMARVSIDAPPHKLILRGVKYREQRGRRY